MKIVFFTENYWKGGLDTFLITLINNWPFPEDQITLICNQQHPGWESYETLISRKVDFVKHTILLSNSLKIMLERAIRPTILGKIIGFLLKYPIFLWDIFALKRVINKCNPDRLMIVNGGYPGGDSCRAAAIGWGIGSKERKSIHNFHNFAIPPKKMFLFIENYIDKWVNKKTSLFVSVSNSCTQSLIKRPAFREKAKSTFIYNGVTKLELPDTLSSIKNELNIEENDFLCLMLATYEPRKGHKFLLDAFRLVVKKASRTFLVVCGYGRSEEIEEIKSYVKKINLENNVFLFSFRKDVPSLLDGADILIVPSQSFESFGLTCIEAMSRSVPVIATKVGGLPEVVKEGEGGFIVDANDIGGLAEKIILLYQNEKLRIEQGKKGFERYKRYFTAQRMAEEYALLIRK